MRTASDNGFRRAAWCTAALTLATSVAASVQAHQLPEAVSFVTVNASPEATDVQLLVRPDAFGLYVGTELDTDADGRISPEELALHRTFVEQYCRRTLLFLWDSRNHLPSLGSMSMAAAAPPYPAMLLLKMRVEGYDSSRPFAIVSRFLGEVPNARTVLTVRHTGKTEMAVLSDEDYYSSDAPPSTPFTTGPGPKRRTASRRGRIVPIAANHVELVYHKDDDSLILYFLGPDRMTAWPVYPDSLSVKVKPRGAEAFEPVPLSPVPDALDERGRCYHFVAHPESLRPLAEFDVDLSMGGGAGRVRKLFSVTPDQLLVDEPVYACPNCPGVAADHPGVRCSRCGTALVPVSGAELPYGDHLPQHGGQFLATVGGWHHVEGTLPSRHEFRFYAYDRHQQATDAGQYRVKSVLARPEEGGIEPTLKLAEDRSCWIATFADELALPVTIRVVVELPNQEQPATFDFPFVITTPSS